MDVPPDLLAVYVPSLALQPLVENAIKHGIGVDSAAGRLEIAAKRHNGRVWLLAARKPHADSGRNAVSEREKDERVLTSL